MAKKNKKLFYKIGLPIGSIGAIVAPLATLVACEDGTTSTSNPALKWQFNSHGIVQKVATSASGVSFLEESGTRFFLAPTTTSSSGDSSDLAAVGASMALSIFRYVQPEMDKYQLDSNGTIAGIAPNRNIVLRFEMIKSMTIEFFNDAPVTFDDDGDDVTNPRNVNGQNFKDQLAKGNVKSFKFNLRDDITQHSWIQQLTGEKGTSITSKDLWRTIFLRHYAIGRNRADATGLSLDAKNDPKSIKNIDARLNSKVRKGYTPFSTGTASTSPGVFKSMSYGLDNDLILNSLNDQNARNAIIPDDQTFILPFSDGKDGITTLANWDELFGKGSAFCATPSDEIDTMITKKEKTLHDMLVGVSDSLDADGKPVHYEFSEADWEALKATDLYKSGYLQWKISQRDEQYVAGKYYFSQSTTKLWVAKINEDYVDPRWLNQKNSKGQSTLIQEFRMKTIQESQVSDMQLANEYIAGTSVTSAFKNLAYSQQIAALKDSKYWGLTFTRGYTGAKMIGDYSFIALLPYLKGSGMVYYNNNFAKAMFGDTAAKYLSAQSTESLIPYQVSGLGAQFRTNLTALINKTAFLRASGNANAMGWDIPFAPEGLIGPDKNNNPVVLSNVVSNPADAAANGVNEEKVVGVNVVKIENGVPKIYPISTNSYLEKLVDTSINRYGPSNEPSDDLPTKIDGKHYSPLEFIKENIKEVLDQQVGPIPADGVIPESMKVTFEFPYSRSMTSVKMNVAYKEFQQFLKTVDPRLNMVAAVNPASESNINSDATVAVNGDGKDGQVEWKDFTTDSSVEAGKLYTYLNRLQPAGKGYSFAPINSTVSYDINSPAAILATNLGYQQSGVLLTLSYLKANSNLLNTGSGFEPLKDLVDFVQTSFTNEQTRFSDINYVNSYKSSKAQVFVDALKNYKFEDLYKSNASDIAKYDYIGWKGVEAVKQIEIDYTKALSTSAKNKTPLSDDDKKIKDDLELFKYEVSRFFENATLKFDREVLSKYSNDAVGTQKKLDIMQAFESLFYQGINPFDMGVGDRRIVQASFSKTWYTEGTTDINGNVDFSRYRVDLDTKDPSNYLTDKVIVGGIVY